MIKNEATPAPPELSGSRDSAGPAGLCRDCTGNARASCNAMQCNPVQSDSNSLSRASRMRRDAARLM